MAWCGAGVAALAILTVGRTRAGENPTAPAPASLRPGMQLVVLGTGTPNADPERSGPALAVLVDGNPYLVDFGAGIVRRIAAARQAGVVGLDMANLRRGFLTHLHSDHTLGFADLILSPWVLERAEPLEVWGPRGTQAMADHLLAAYQEDIRMRLYGLEPANDQGYRVIVHEIQPGPIYRDEHVAVTAFGVRHGSWPEAFGYTFESADRRIVISGDTRPTDAVVEQCHGCDLLVHEVYSAEKLAARPPEWQTYHRAFHTSTTELAALALRARPKMLVLYHQLFWGATDADLEAEVRAAGWTGPVVSARDLAVY